MYIQYIHTDTRIYTYGIMDEICIPDVRRDGVGSPEKGFPVRIIEEVNRSRKMM